ncbi:hypothetical protein TraAM80_07491 [Trypanosoma rangeli]|uniref:Uncharacterized protein n=1 Tax=Trypanosoma rangeli TaxID=5698 RepID=A0A3R7K2C3_TRYRA|nr:uncharacterized protein TraAM80_07491 [Trypanosoma rangeli]RNF00558.1 hypothetical protein TraAM80_07491 [Trypanosoma rangeli]|eukprot:RNF00558.1 hypothetical protein TraAM80_07491 [Trypanosoma rangeli]
MKTQSVSAFLYTVRMMYILKKGSYRWNSQARYSVFSRPISTRNASSQGGKGFAAAPLTRQTNTTAAGEQRVEVAGRTQRSVPTSSCPPPVAMNVNGVISKSGLNGYPVERHRCIQPPRDL